MDLFWIGCNDRTELLFRIPFPVQVCQEPSPFRVEGGGEDGAVQDGIQLFHHGNGLLTQSAVLFWNSVEQSQRQPGFALVPQTAGASLTAFVDGQQVVPVADLSDGELIAFGNSAFAHDLFQERLDLEFVHGVQQLHHQLVDGQGIPMEQEEQLRGYIVLGKQGAAALPEDHRLHIFLHPPVVHGFHQIAFRHIKVAAEQGDADRDFEKITQGNDAVELLGALFDAQLLAQDLLPFVPVHAELFGLGGVISQPELRPVDQLHQADIAPVVVMHDLFDSVTLGNLLHIALAHHDGDSAFQDLLLSEVIFGYVFHRVVLDPEGVPLIFLHQGDHRCAVEPVVEQVAVGVRHPGQPVGAFRQQKPQLRVLLPASCQPPEGRRPPGGIVQAQQRLLTGGDDAADILIELRGFRLGERRIFLGTDPQGDAAAAHPVDCSAQHDGGLAGAAVAGEDGGIAGVAQRRQPIVHLVMGNILPLADDFQHPGEVQIHHVEFLGVRFREFLFRFSDGVSVQNVGDAADTVPGLLGSGSLQTELPVQMFQNGFQLA